MQALTDRIIRKVRSSRERVHVSRDFSALGKRAAIDQALSRLVRTRHLVRIARGMFVEPSAQFSQDDLARAIGRASRSKIVITGARAAELFGLTTVKSDPWVFLTDGACRSVEVGGFRIDLRHGSPRDMSGPNGRVGDALRALRWLGQDMSDNAVIAQMRSLLSPRERRSLLMHARGSQWLVDLAEQIASEEPLDTHVDASSLRRKARLLDRLIRPTNRRPAFEQPRFWSNASLNDARTIVALTLEKPTVADLTRSVVAYGALTHVETLEALIREDEISSFGAARAGRALDLAFKGVDDARRQLAAA